MKPDGIRLSHIEWIVGPKTQPIGTVRPHETVHLPPIEYQGVHPQPAQVAGRQLPAAFGAFRSRPPAMVHPAPVTRQIAAAVSHADPQPGEPIEHAAKDEVPDGQGRLERIADEIVEVVLAHAAGLREAQR